MPILPILAACSLMGDSCPPPCSASSDVADTPETKDAYKQRNGEGALDHEIRRARTMEKLERQRNAAWKLLREIRELFTADESFGATVEALFAKPLEEAEAEIARLQSMENASDVPCADARPLDRD